MKTDDLIAALAADNTPRPTPGARMAQALPVALLLSLVALVLLWRVRPDLAAALGSAAAVKTIVPVLLTLVALWLARGMTRPEARARAQWALVAVMVLAGGLALAQGIATQGFAGLIGALDTPNLITCLVSIPVLSALPLAASFWAMKSGAPANPRLAGVAAGLLAGAGGTAIYSLHCPEDSLLFCLPAYGGTMLIVVAAGALLGPRLLRW
ncbi:MAG: DUF1109 domain-containing protein [Rhodobacteraceae bacterium]|jgi:hypothetical protein|nr:DUF1109 domain-containing protein [Paracoccaceae bacterium]